MTAILILTFAFAFIIAYIVLDKLYTQNHVINRIYTYIDQEVKRKKAKPLIVKKQYDIKIIINKIKQSIIKQNIKKTKYFKKFNQQLSDAIIVISNSLKAGHSFAQALNTLVLEMPAPASTEFSKVVREVKLGKSLESSLEDLQERMPSKDLELMITAILIQKETGGNLAEVLDIISETIRERIKIQGEINALTAQGKLSAIVVSALPIALAAVMSVMSPDYISGLLTSGLGIAMIILGVFSELLGIWFISKIVKIDV